VSDTAQSISGSRSDILHATCVAVDDKAALILGPSGSGKSGLALSMMALGATLVSDDRVMLEVNEGGVWARPPDAIAGLIEMRGIGLLRAPFQAPVRLSVVVDLACLETDRLPRQRQMTVLGSEISLLHRVDTPYFGAGLIQFLRFGRLET
jgi:HPr kinase/phosphorylase